MNMTLYMLELITLVLPTGDRSGGIQLELMIDQMGDKELKQEILLVKYDAVRNVQTMKKMTKLSDAGALDFGDQSDLWTSLLAQMERFDGVVKVMDSLSQVG